MTISIGSTDGAAGDSGAGTMDADAIGDGEGVTIGDAVGDGRTATWDAAGPGDGDCAAVCGDSAGEARFGEVQPTRPPTAKAAVTRTRLSIPSATTSLARWAVDTAIQLSS